MPKLTQQQRLIEALIATGRGTPVESRSRKYVTLKRPDGSFYFVSGVVALVRKHPGCVVAMEACCGAHHLGRIFVADGHEVRLMSPEYVRPYVKAHKNDDRDAEAIAEAAMRPTMRLMLRIF